MCRWRFIEVDIALVQFAGLKHIVHWTKLEQLRLIGTEILFWRLLPWNRYIGTVDYSTILTLLVVF